MTDRTRRHEHRRHRGHGSERAASTRATGTPRRLHGGRQGQDHRGARHGVPRARPRLPRHRGAVHQGQVEDRRARLRREAPRASLRHHVMGLGLRGERRPPRGQGRRARRLGDGEGRDRASGDRDLVVLDELTYGRFITTGSSSSPRSSTSFRGRPAHVHVVVTGRNAAPELLEAADLATEDDQAFS